LNQFLEEKEYLINEHDNDFIILQKDSELIKSLNRNLSFKNEELMVGLF
jgi:hypothetical protein